MDGSEKLVFAPAVVVDLNDRHEGLLRDIDFAHCPHPLLSLGLLLQKLLLPRNVSYGFINIYSHGQKQRMR